MTTTPAFLGRGFSFPLRLDATGTRPSFSENETLVKESIDAILNTRIGERPHRVRNGVPFGTRLQSVLFSPSTVVVDIAKFDVRRALTTWEPRIVVLNVAADTTQDPTTRAAIVVVNVTFRYRATNRVDNFVIPYRTQPVEGQL